jgi:hypothetical protein
VRLCEPLQLRILHAFSLGKYTKTFGGNFPFFPVGGADEQTGKAFEGILYRAWLLDSDANPSGQNKPLFLTKSRFFIFFISIFVSQIESRVNEMSACGASKRTVNFYADYQPCLLQSFLLYS